jgi:hypothetical protein
MANVASQESKFYIQFFSQQPHSLLKDIPVLPRAFQKTLNQQAKEGQPGVQSESAWSP